ncbi:MAG TPA: hypothetical protein V6D12_22700 [Candidatus Obscuribacterales bacterium]
METMKVRSHIGTDGILQIQMPADFKNTFVEVVVVVQPLSFEKNRPQYNAWGKLTTKQSIQEAIARRRQWRQEVALKQTSIREMI